MTVKEFKKFLSQFPDDAKVCTDTNNYYSADGISYATLIEIGDNGEKILFVGNTRHVGSEYGEYENYEYNLRNLKIIKTLSIWDK